MWNSDKEFGFENEAEPIFASDVVKDNSLLLDYAIEQYLKQGWQVTSLSNHQVILEKDASPRISWILVIIGFLFFWPIGIGLLIYRFRSNQQPRQIVLTTRRQGKNLVVDSLPSAIGIMFANQSQTGFGFSQWDGRKKGRSRTTGRTSNLQFRIVIIMGAMFISITMILLAGLGDSEPSPSFNTNDNVYIWLPSSTNSTQCVAIYANAGDLTTVIELLSQGTPITITQESRKFQGDYWYKVLTETGISGWIQEHYLSYEQPPTSLGNCVDTGNEP